MKYYTYDAERQIGGGINAWRSREAAERWHDANYKLLVEATYGSVPTIGIVDATLFVDPIRGIVERV